MSKQREALQVALDTLRGWIGIDEWIWPVTAKETCKKNSLEAITAIREALAEPEKANQCGETCERAKLCAVCANGLVESEPWTPDDMAYRPGGLPMDAEQAPVAWMCPHDPERETAFSWRSGMCEFSGCGHQRIPLYTAPPADRLIAAAPDLLAELVSMTDAYAKAMKDSGVSYYPEALAIVRNARTAIAKARGQE